MVCALLHDLSAWSVVLSLARLITAAGFVYLCIHRLFHFSFAPFRSVFVAFFIIDQRLRSVTTDAKKIDGNEG